ncbi:lytic transglycosylase domain-containing protein [Nocardioides flavescens]|uniref:aggregation-promoting factor C-terminal-like domain-containing protein n=1 Tax=Nocardioides flavescens TaxID=2691959 RepID=UPI0019292EB9
MSSYVKHAPKHRAKHRAPRARRAPKVALKTSLTLSSMAVVATGLAVGSGSSLLGGPDATVAASASARTAVAGTTDVNGSGASSGQASGTSATSQDAPAADAAQDAPDAEASETTTLTARAPEVTRSESRVPAADPLKRETLDLGDSNALTRTEDLSDEDPRTIAQALLPEFGFDQDQFGCLDSLWTRESGWNPSADNPSSSAYGIPQALPGSKMSSAGADWATNPVTQIRWGLGYIRDRYGSPCAAWGHSEAQGFY